jgi:hypothetical protein
MVLSVHQPHYLPWLGFFDKIAHSDAFVYLDQVQYKVREFQNRNKIRTRNGAVWLSVPVITKGQGRQPIKDIAIDNSLRWMRQHYNSIKIWYAQSPYCREHLPFFEELYETNWEKLADVNVHIAAYFLKQLAIKTPVYFESKLGTACVKTGRIIELCNFLKADTYLSGAGGRDYLEEEKFKTAGIKLEYQNFEHPRYRQQFMRNQDDFLPYMSTVDLLFNEGPNSRKILGLE